MKNMYYKIVLYSFIFLVLFGLLMIYSSSSVWALFRFNDSFHYVKMQSLFIIISLFLVYKLSLFDLDILYNKCNKLLFISIILLILVIVPFIGKTMNGSRSWFMIGPFGIQPSELSKLTLIIYASKYLSNNNMRSFKDGVLPLLFILFIVFFLIMLEPDLGTATIIFITILAMIFISGAKKKFFYLMFILGLFGFTSLIIIAPYRMKRITSFINPWNDPLDSGFQIIQSLYAIGPSGLLGRGLFNSVQKEFFLPEPQTDFIFSIIVEELGIVGCLIILFLFSSIIYISIKCSLKEENSFKKYLLFGLTFQLAFQMIMNLMVATSLIPITGVTLPFISYGGSSFIISTISIGIILNIIKN